VEVFYFTYTGFSEVVAREISSFLGAKPKKIETYRWPYFFWLFLSFIPYFPVKSWFEPPQEEKILVCFPKWTFNCPPVTYFLRKIRCKHLFLLVCYKGWGEDHYIKIYRSLGLTIAENVEIFFINQKTWQKDLSKIIEIFRGDDYASSRGIRPA
jgi:hypothetical protein